MPAVVSASRRTDLPGFHAAWLADRLARFRRPPDALFLWTKHPAAVARPGPLRDAVRRLPNVLVHLTITGLGAGPLEPRVPAWREVLAEVPRLLDALGGDPRRILWRFDPVIPGLSSREDFAHLAARLGALGVRRCISSFFSTMSLKGSLLPQYARFGLIPPTAAERVDWAGTLGARARSEGLELSLCCQPKVVERLGGAVPAASCIDAGLATALHPEGRAIAAAKDRSQSASRNPGPSPAPRDGAGCKERGGRIAGLCDRRATPQTVPSRKPGDGRDFCSRSQRRHCGCAPSLDLGDYAGHACRSGCGYCYSRAGGPDVPVS